MQLRKPKLTDDVYRQKNGYPKLLSFPQLGDRRGELIAIEGNADIPFHIKRVFYIYGSDAALVRGKHANKKSEFVMISVSGKCKIDVADGLGYKESFDLDCPHTGVYLPRLIWKEMYGFSKDCILLVLASEHYSASEYLHDYDIFLNEITQAKLNRPDDE